MIHFIEISWAPFWEYMGITSIDVDFVDSSKRGERWSFLHRKWTLNGMEGVDTISKDEADFVVGYMHIHAIIHPWFGGVMLFLGALTRAGDKSFHCLTNLSASHEQSERSGKCANVPLSSFCNPLFWKRIWVVVLILDGVEIRWLRWLVNHGGYVSA